MTYRNAVPLSVALPPSLIRCKSIVLNDEDRLSVGDYVIFQTRRNSPHDDLTQVGRVDEIVVDPDVGRIDGALLTQCAVGEAVQPYRMPSCKFRRDKRIFVPFEACPTPSPPS